jgi:putative transposase
VSQMCTFLNVSRAAYYAWIKRISKPDDDYRIEMIKQAYKASHRTYGYRRVQMWITQKCGVVINHKAVLRLMNKLGVHSVARKRKFMKKKEDLGTYHQYPNLLNREFSAKLPNQKWVTDITFIQTQQGWAFLSTIKDLYDGFIVAHHFA